jgi:hypothetical protein
MKHHRFLVFAFAGLLAIAWSLHCPQSSFGETKKITKATPKASPKKSAGAKTDAPAEDDLSKLPKADLNKRLREAAKADDRG